MLLISLLFGAFIISCGDREFAPRQAVDQSETFEDSLYLPFGKIVHEASYGVDISAAIEDNYVWIMRLSETGPAPEFKNWRLDLVENTGTGPVADLCTHSVSTVDSVVTIMTACTIEPERDLNFRTQIDFDDEFIYEIMIVADFTKDSIVYAEMNFPLQETKAILTESLQVERPADLGYSVISIVTNSRRNQGLTEDNRVFTFDVSYSERFSL